MEIQNVKNIVTGVIHASTTPARYYPNVDGGTILINTPVYSKLPTPEKFFVLLHECGHAHLQTRDEREADRWAFEQYAAAGYPLSESVFALTRILNQNRPEHLERMQLQFERAANFDYFKNGNQKIEQIMDTNIEGNSANMAWVEECHAEFLGFGKDAKAKRQAKQEAKLAKKEAKTDLIKAKAEQRRSGNYQSGFEKIAGSVVDGAKSLLGLPTAAEKQAATEGAPADDTAANATPTQKNKTLIIILIVVVVVVVGLLVWKFAIKKK